MSRIKDYIQGIAISTLKDTDENYSDNILTIKYDTGCFTIDLFKFLPAANTDIKKICTMIDRIYDYSTQLATAQKFYNFVVSYIGAFKEYQDSVSFADNKKTAQYFIDKLAKNADCIAELYTLEKSEEVVSEHVTMKKADFYILQHYSEDDTEHAILKSGKKFQKYGRSFYVYKDKKRAASITDPVSGMQITYCNSINDAPSTITEDVISAIDKAAISDLRYKNLSYIFYGLCKEDQYNFMVDPDQLKMQSEYNAITDTDTADNTDISDTAPGAADITDTDTDTADTDTADTDTAEPYDIDYAELLNVFNERYSYFYNLPRGGAELEYYHKAIDIFDNSLNARDKATLKKFVEFRKDFISSDREAASFVCALIDILNSVQTECSAPTESTVPLECSAPSESAAPLECSAPSESAAPLECTPGSRDTPLILAVYSPPDTQPDTMHAVKSLAVHTARPGCSKIRVYFIGVKCVCSTCIGAKNPKTFCNPPTLKKLILSAW